MIRNLKALGLALVAVFAMSAMAASAAQATFDAEATAESFPAIMDGKQIGEMVLTRGGVPITCGTANFNATVTKAGETSVTVTPSYSNCHATGPFGETWPITVTMGDCDYKFTLTASAADVFTARSDVECGSSPSITIDIYFSANDHEEGFKFCTIHIPPQNNLNTITLTNKAAGGVTPKDWIEADVNVSGITSTRTGSGACGPLHSATGTLLGAAELKGTTVTGADNGITVSTHS